MNIWDIKQRIITVTNKIILEDDFEKRLALSNTLDKLHDELTSKIVKIQMEYKYKEA